jgi:hypothetical protein
LKDDNLQGLGTGTKNFKASARIPTSTPHISLPSLIRPKQSCRGRRALLSIYTGFPISLTSLILSTSSLAKSSLRSIQPSLILSPHLLQLSRSSTCAPVQSCAPSSRIHSTALLLWSLILQLSSCVRMHCTLVLRCCLCGSGNLVELGTISSNCLH